MLTTWGNPGSTAWYVAPSYRQAKRIAWERLKSMLPRGARAAISETELTIRLQQGGEIALRGADQYDSLRGNGLDFVVLDEFASMKPEVWPEVIRPALADRQGAPSSSARPRATTISTISFNARSRIQAWQVQARRIAARNLPAVRAPLPGH